MDAGDYIYIIIAIVLAIINAVANKKKKDAAKRNAAASQQGEIQREPADILQEILMGKGAVFQETKTQNEESDWYDEDEELEEIPSKDTSIQGEKTPQYWNYEVKEEPVNSIEYEHRYEEVSEERLYSNIDVKPIDLPENASFSAIDTPISADGSIEEFNYESLSIKEEEGDDLPDMIFEHEKAMEMEASALTIADEFDARKAIIYSEIMTPKYI